MGSVRVGVDLSALKHCNKSSFKAVLTGFHLNQLTQAIVTEKNLNVRD